MVEKLRIEVEADVTSASEEFKAFREEVRRTSGEVEKNTDAMRKNGTQANKGGLGELAKDLGQISPQLGKVTRGIESLSQSFKKLGIEFNKSGAGGIFGTLSGRAGKVLNSNAFRKGLGVAALAGTAASLLGGMFNNGGNSKLAPFDKLNDLGQMSILDWLMEKLPKLLEPLGLMGGIAAGLGSILSLMRTNPEYSPTPNPTPATDPAEYKKTWDNANIDIWKVFALLGAGAINGIKDQIGRIWEDSKRKIGDIWDSFNEGINSIKAATEGMFDGSIASSLVQIGLFNNINDLSNQIKNVNDNWFSGPLTSGILSLFNSILSTAGQIGSTIASWGSGSSGGSSIPKITTPDPTPTPTTDPTPSPSPTSGGPGSSSSGKSLLEDLWDSAGQAVADVGNALSNSGLILGGGRGLTINGSRYSKEDGQNAIIDTVLTAATGAVGKVASGVGSAVGKVASEVSKFADDIGKGISNIFNGVGSFFGFAEGGVFQPNQPQLAILGDNKTEPEVAAPYSLMVSAVHDAIAGGGSGGGGGASLMGRSEPINITLELDGRTLARLTYDYYKNEERRRNGVGSI